MPPIQLRTSSPRSVSPAPTVIDDQRKLFNAAKAAHLDAYTMQRVQDMASSSCGDECILSWHNLEADGAKVIASALAKNTNVLKLNLGWNNLQAAGGRAIAAALAKNKSLHELSLSDNHLGPVGCAAIAGSLKSNGTLHTLFLYNNDVGHEGCKAIADALLVNTSLTRLSLSRNHLGPACAKALAEALRTNTTLKNLDLGWNEIGEEGARALAEAVCPGRHITITLDAHEKEVFDQVMAVRRRAHVERERRANSDGSTQRAATPPPAVKTIAGGKRKMPQVPVGNRRAVHKLQAELHSKEQAIEELQEQVASLSMQLNASRSALASSHVTSSVLLACVAIGAAFAWSHARQHL